jgi:hypothetical protein
VRLKLDEISARFFLDFDQFLRKRRVYCLQVDAEAGEITTTNSKVASSGDSIDGGNNQLLGWTLTKDDLPKCEREPSNVRAAHRLKRARRQDRALGIFMFYPFCHRKGVACENNIEPAPQTSYVIEPPAKPLQELAQEVRAFLEAIAKQGSAAFGWDSLFVVLAKRTSEDLERVKMVIVRDLKLSLASRIVAKGERSEPTQGVI